VIVGTFTALNTLRARPAVHPAVDQCGAKVRYKDSSMGQYLVDLLLNSGTPHRFICVICVHRLPASATKIAMHRHPSNRHGRARPGHQS
jgi:hypothetical protein